MKDISLHIMDIAQNSISAGAALVEIKTEVNEVADRMIVTITDNGRGMDKNILEKAADPFYTSRVTRRVGLGIPLFRHSAEQTGGSLEIISEPGIGTSVIATFIRSSVDRPPAGDIPGVISLLAGANPDRDFVYRHLAGSGEYVFDTRQVKDVLGDVPLSEPVVIRYMKEMIDETIRDMLIPEL